MSPYIYAGLRHPIFAPPSIARIAATVAEHYDLTLADLNGSLRQQPIPEARQVICYLIHRAYPALSCAEIGSRSFARAIPRSGVSYALRTISSLLTYDQQLATRLQLLATTLCIKS